MKIVLVEPSTRSALQTKRPQERVQMSKREGKELAREIHAIIHGVSIPAHPMADKLGKLVGVDINNPEEQ